VGSCSDRGGDSHSDSEFDLGDRDTGVGSGLGSWEIAAGGTARSGYRHGSRERQLTPSLGPTLEKIVICCQWPSAATQRVLTGVPGKYGKGAEIWAFFADRSPLLTATDSK